MMTDQTEETPRAQVDETEWVDYMQRLYDAERAGARSPIWIGPYSAILLIGALQLATRNPNMSEAHRRIILDVVDQFRPFFEGTIGEELINLGNDPTQDR